MCVCAHSIFSILNQDSAKRKLLIKEKHSNKKRDVPLYKTHPNVIECHEMS